jgi:hypothetical protein
MSMAPGLKISLWLLRAYLVPVMGLVLYHVLDLAG